MKKSNSLVFLLFALIIIIALMCSCKPQQLTSTYNMQMFDEAYIRIDKQFRTHETIIAKRLGRKLKIDSAYFTNKAIYIPITFEHINKTNIFGRMIIKNEYREKLAYSLPK